MREMLKTALASDAYSVVEANNGAEALGLFRNGRFDLVLLDLEMPFLKGDELAMRIKQLVPEQPILMITGHYVRPGLTNPVDALMRKPFVYSQLSKVMTTLMAEVEVGAAALNCPEPGNRPLPETATSSGGTEIYYQPCMVS